MRKFLLLLCMFASVSTWASIGSVSEQSGNPGEITRGKDKVAGNKGAGIESNDIGVGSAPRGAAVHQDEERRAAEAV